MSPWPGVVPITDHVPGMERCRLVIVMSPVHSVAMVTLCRERTLPGHWGLHWNVHWEGELCDAFNASLSWGWGEVTSCVLARRWLDQGFICTHSRIRSGWSHPCDITLLSIFLWHPVSTLWPCTPCAVCDTLAGLTLQLASHSRQMAGWTTLSLSGAGSRVARFHDPA